MKLKEFRKLAKSEKESVVERPKHMMHMPEAEITEKRSIANMLIDLIASKYDYDEMYKISGYEKHLTSFYNLTGKGVFENPYVIETNFGYGKFCDLHTYFKTKKYPEFIIKRYCHTNCYQFAKKINSRCKILSGIAYKNYPFLHSVLLMDNYILDFNYDLLMTKELYCSLFNFEVLNVINGDDVKKYADKMEAINCDRLTYADVVFCFYDILNKLENNTAISL